MRRLSHYEIQDIIDKVISITVLPVVGVRYGYHACKAKLLKDEQSAVHCLHTQSWFRMNFVRKKLWRL